MPEPEFNEVDLLIATRVWRLYTEHYGKSCFLGLKVSDLVKYKPISTFVPVHERPDSKAWDLGRVRHFYEELLTGKTLDPIDVDNDCSGGRIHAIPIVLDGHHRLVAAVLAKKRIPARYAGRVDLLDYLKGERKQRPPV